MVKRIVTGAHYGLRDWLAQRVTAVVMVVFIIFLAAMVLISPP
ncbi:MAG: succinate dehydrogenase, hydrophobic membrane anchor protein, partial [Nitrosospira sp.]